MTTDVLYESIRLRRSKRYSLAQLVSAHFIPIIDTSLAIDHKRKMVDDSRYGIFRFVGPVLYALSAMLTFIFNDDRRAFYSLLCMVALLMVSVIGAFVAPAEPMLDLIMHIMFWVTLASIVIPIVHIMLAALSTVEGTFVEYALASTIWERRAVKNAEGHLDLSFVPDNLHDRIKRASMIPDAEVFIERFSFDPLVLVKRGSGLRSEVVYIGGWDTKNPLIDNA